MFAYVKMIHVMMIWYGMKTLGDIVKQWDGIW
jgi:hypothetical protein